MSFYGLTAFIALLSLCTADVMVQLNVNRPLNDVSEKFVSFAIKPEDLYQTLDGPNRKTWTRMAAMLGDSYVKFVGDYHFASSSELKFRNPTRIIWKGFNRWSRAVNWTMIIPVPYSPKTWDPMETLKILNTSHMGGITDCIWQLGDDFGSSRAQDYVTELETFNLMVDSFKPYVEDWKIIGADISAGSSADETRRYIEMSKDINAAYGWAQSSDLAVANVDGLSNYINENDPALRMLLTKKVPVWLSLPVKSMRIRKSKSKSKSNNLHSDNEVIEGLHWAKILGDAASAGFETVFKKLSLADLERPDFSFYVTAVFKRVMGSRVFPTRALNLFARFNKLYTHCANDVSGGIAFMVVNTDDEPLQISVRSMTKFTGTEVWQYSLTSKKGVSMLNNEKLSLNSTLMPQIKVRNLNKPVQLTTPGMSVNFWVFPSVNLDHCQYSEIEAQEAAPASTEKVIEKRFSSSDKLLRKLIQESSLSHGPKLGGLLNRDRRQSASRSKRFILDDGEEKAPPFRMNKLFEPFGKNIIKRDHNDALNNEKGGPFKWLINQFLDNSLKSSLPLLKRNARSVDDDDYFGSFFTPKNNNKRNSFTRRITEIRKPEVDVKPIFDLDNFDEERFFKEIAQRSEPEYVRPPEGDVHLKHISNPEGDEYGDDEEYEEKRKYGKKSKRLFGRSKEVVNEMKPMKLLPTEFYESQSENAFNPMAKKIGFGSALNSLLFPENKQKGLFMNNKMVFGKNFNDQRLDASKESEENEDKKTSSAPVEEDFFGIRKKLGKSVSDDENISNKAMEQEDEFKSPLFSKSKNYETERRKYIDHFMENMDNYFGENKEKEEKIEPRNEELRKTKTKENRVSTKENVQQSPWWDLSPYYKKRLPRSLKYNNADEAWQANMITKDDEIMPLGAVVPEQLALQKFEYKMLTTTPKTATNANAIANLYGRVTGNSILNENISERDNSIPNQSDNKGNVIVNQNGNNSERGNAIINHNSDNSAIENISESTNDNEKSDKTAKIRLVTAVQQNLNKIVDILRRHVSQWYHTFAGHNDRAAVVTTATTTASLTLQPTAVAGNRVQ